MQKSNCIFTSSDYSSFCFFFLTSTIKLWLFSWLFCLICLYFAFEMCHNYCVSQIFIPMTNTWESNLKHRDGLFCFQVSVHGQLTLLLWAYKAESHGREFVSAKLLTSQPRTERNGIATTLQRYVYWYASSRRAPLTSSSLMLFVDWRSSHDSVLTS